MKDTMDDHGNRTAGRRARRTAQGLCLALLGLSLVVGPAASAKDEDPQKKTFDCKDTSSVKLKVVARDGGVLEVSAVVFSDDSDVWDWKMRHNDDTSAKGTVKAKDADKSFKIVRDMADFVGTDFIDFRAENASTGEVCKAELAYN